MSVLEEIQAVAMRPKDDHIVQYGIKKRSGRYPYGSGEDPFQHDPQGFLKQVRALQAEGKTEKEIAEALGLTYDDGTASSTLYRRAVRYATHKERQALVTQAQTLRSEGKSLNEIAKIMGYDNDSSVRTLLNTNTKSNKEKAFNVAEALKEEVEKKGVVDVGDKAEMALGCSKGTLDEAIWILTTENSDFVYEGIGIGITNNKGKKINTAILHKDNITTKEIYDDTSKIQQLGDFHSTDGGNTIDKLQYPASIDADRVGIRYGDEGGASKDGVIEIRRGVEDLSLGNSHYAQVRILVNGDHYLKGMAMYSDDLPDGVDIMFNTNKKSGTDKMDVLKKTKENEFDPNNPFGAAIKANGQSWYIDSETGEKKLSAVNKLKEEGDWEKQDNNLSSQFLAKQPMKLINNQLDVTYKSYADTFEEINKLENPTVRKQELLDFAGKCDKAATELKAAALPRQKWQVILPVDELKNEEDDGVNEVYAPNFKNGEKVALVRYPHAGTFEIPICTVNNNNPAAKAKLGNATDAIGINTKVAARLSGADFDGDTVIAIPTGNGVNIKATKALEGLKDFNPSDAYPKRDGMKVMTEKQKQKQMGVVSNLITDMTLRNANDDELACAVRHSMVVIDAVKHELDYKASEEDNHIAELKAKYQTRYDDVTGEQKSGGASTLLSRRKQTVQVNEHVGIPIIDKETGEVTYKESGRTYLADKSGNQVYKQKDGTYVAKDKKTGERKTVDEKDVQTVRATTEVSRLSTEGLKAVYGTTDARNLSSGTAEENAYADYANKMLALANKARKTYANTEDAKRNPAATVKYAAEVESLNKKLAQAAENAPRERRAQAVAQSKIKAAKAANPNMDKDTLKKLGQRAIEDARAEAGASGKKSKNFDITEKEWEAIQNHAISSTNLKQILRYADSTKVKQLAMPKTNKISDAKVARIKALRNAGYTAAEIAEQTGVSTSTIYKLTA